MSFRRSIAWARLRNRQHGIVSRFPTSMLRCATRPAPSCLRHIRHRQNALDEREQSARAAQKMECSITVLNVGRMNDDAQQETQRIDQDVPLATFDLLARVVA